MINFWRILQISEHAKNFFICFLKAIIFFKAERVDNFETAKNARVYFVTLLVYLFLYNFKGAFCVDFQQPKYFVHLSLEFEPVR